MNTRTLLCGFHSALSLHKAFIGRVFESLASRKCPEVPKFQATSAELAFANVNDNFKQAIQKFCLSLAKSPGAPISE
jgi:hypothetical protein